MKLTSMQQINQLEPIEFPLLPSSPLVSILIPNYNYARYIGEALDSVLDQTYPNFEVIVCDDGSKDNSCEVIESYVQRDSRIKLIQKENGGVANALNVAYSKSKGQIICILDADDIWMSNKLQKVVELYISEPKCGFAIHNVLEIDGQGNFLHTTPKIKQLASGWMGEFAMENGGFVYNIPPASALSIRREIGDKIFPLNEAFTRNADSLIFRLAPFITVIGAVQEVLSKFRLHGANVSSQSTLSQKILEREEVTFERVYEEQKKFLQKIYGEQVARQLKELKFSLRVCHDKYLLARFKGVSKLERALLHRQVISHAEFRNFCLHQKWLFQWGEYLPDSVFHKLFLLTYGSSPFKRFARRIIKG
ncbi:MAG: glycosyltransferase [Rivularia sp. (in: cyanobacteria)]